MGSCMCVSLSYYITVQTLNCRSCFRHLNMEKLKQLSPTVYGLCHFCHCIWVMGKVQTCTTANEMCVHVCHARFLNSQWSINRGAVMFACHLASSCAKENILCVWSNLCTVCLMWWQLMIIDGASLLTLKHMQLHTEANIPEHELETLLMTESQKRPDVSPQFLFLCDS